MTEIPHRRQNAEMSAEQLALQIRTIVDRPSYVSADVSQKFNDIFYLLGRHYDIGDYRSKHSEETRDKMKSIIADLFMRFSKPKPIQDYDVFASADR